MSEHLSHFQGVGGVGLDAATLEALLAEHEGVTLPKLARLWAYYRNPLEAPSRTPSSDSSRAWYRQAQEVGLPARIVGRPTSRDDDRRTGRREVVIENDIGWRIQTMVDFMFAKPVGILSTAASATKRREIERALDLIWESSGGIALLQDMALLGHVYGHVDLVLRVDPRAKGRTVEEIAREGLIRVEIVSPTRSIAILDPHDYRNILAYVITYVREGAPDTSLAPATENLSPLRRWQPRRPLTSSPEAPRNLTRVVEIISIARRQVYENAKLILDESPALFGDQLPIVHAHNISQPFRYEGQGEVEALIPLQDELNTRLSDRACRVTLQSFKMYLAKGFDGLENAQVSPGTVWSTDNPDATVQAFGGDAETPGEERHIAEIREALDKVSAVPPVAGGVVQAKIGNLTSANALRITLMGLLSKTARKRVTYGGAIARMSALILRAFDNCGTLATSEADRTVKLEWPDPLPEDEQAKVAAAETKSRLGVPRERLLAELGYAPTDPGVA